MKVFLDTSVMIAAFWGDHRDHDASLRVFAETNRKTAACGIHSLAEVYATMTALPVRPLLAPEQVLLLVQQIVERLTTVVLDEAEYLETLSEVAERGFSSGQVYDALLLACARKSRAETIYTWDLKHFRQIAPDLAEHIRTP
ncbi:MAG TPA: PIN domain-containing protein [Bryobacteraceae bacterium]|nr:PIN domain-containing protein [Bryobacteraceae bacterium]